MQEQERLMENPDVASSHRQDREIDLAEWNEQEAQRIAAEEGIQLSDEHWNVVHCLRRYHLEQGPAKNGRELGDMLDAQYADQGGRKYLRKLFPEGPVAQGMRIAGLPVPPHTEDAGFGTSR